MKSLRFRCLLAIAVFSTAPWASAQGTNGTTQTAPTSDPQAVLLVSEAQVALMGTTSVADIVINANSQWIAGGTKSTGTATLKAKGIAEARLDISGDTVKRAEIRNDSSGPDGRWSGTDGALHPVSPHNCWAPAGWFAPHALIQTMSSPGMVLRYSGQETHSGITTDRIQAYRFSTEKDPKLATDLERLSTLDVFLDSGTHLPAAVVFNTHPDNDSGRDIPIEIRFSDYRNVSGVMVPFAIQRFLQGVLNLDLTVTSATLNSGLADSEFALQ